jgi:hypothetical protein
MAVTGKVVSSRVSWVKNDCRTLPESVCATRCLDWPGVPTKRTGAYPFGSPMGKPARKVYRGRRLFLADSARLSKMAA